jgi:hypothetical protein
MAFCPNCGTPNTEQAVKCVSCGFELAPAQQKGKFKGTIMMSGVKAPLAQPASAPAPAPSAAPAPQSAPPANRNLAFEKTMLGPMAAVPQAPAAPNPDLASAATLEGPAPSNPPQRSSGEPISRAPAASFSGAADAYGSAQDAYPARHPDSDLDGEDGLAPVLPRPNTNKLLALGCAALLVLGTIVAIAVYRLAKDKLSTGAAQDDAATQAWRNTLGQALTQVSGLCQSDCASAANYFHPSVQAGLLGQAKQLSPARLQKLLDPAQTQASMLPGTEDTAVATGLGLDPQLCVRIVDGAAKAVGCSVPNPGGPADMRIVLLAGLETL